MVTINLLANAIKFTEIGSVKLLVLAESNTNNSLDLTLTVQDTGIGISKKDQQRIFDVFTQSEGQSNRKYGGTGLGLTITKRLTEMLGGKISLKSTLGQGSAFTVQFSQVPWLYSLPELQDQSNISLTSLAQLPPLRILVVDDIDSNRIFLSDFFE